jgi:endonuclease-3 related protein
LPWTIEEVLSLLRDEYDVQSWWPGSSAFEVALGAILTQQTRWENVLLCLESLRDHGLLDVERLAAADTSLLEELIRPCGFFRQKAHRIQYLCRHILDVHGGETAGMLQGGLDECRRELMSLPGIGPETADSILLYGGGRPVFVAASYCLRVLNRTGACSFQDYEEVRENVEQELGPDPLALGDLYALLVELAKEHCRKQPICKGCPLETRCSFKVGRT